MKIEGEYKQCPTCRRPYQRRFPPHTPMTHVRVRGVGYLITPHEQDCRWVAEDA